LHGSNFGLGPIQSSHVRRQVQALQQSIEQAASRSAEPAARAYSRSVFVNGEPVSDEELARLELGGVRVQDGCYWYDRVCGAWGLEGCPTAGFIQPGFSLGGPLRADASNGQTGVFIVGGVMPGRWWVDAQGNFGLEGGPLVGNLWWLAQQRNAVAGRSSRTSSASGVTAGGEGGFVYAQGRDALGNPFSAWSG
jgi:hypothetical protein